MSAMPRKRSDADSVPHAARPDHAVRTTSAEHSTNLTVFDPDSPTASFDSNSSDADATIQSASVRWPIWIPLISILVVSAVIRVYDIDRKLSSLNYDPAAKVWPLERADPWLSFYRYGIYPPLLVGTVGALGLMCGRWIWRDADPSHLRTMRRGGLFLVLLLAIGPGLLVNTGLKMMWGRPRPLQCQEFGGELAFHSVGDWSTYNLPNSSFPSGHASIAFFLMGPAFIINPRHTRLRRYWLAGGIGYGLAMGFTRILQGGHFLSDVLWAGVIVYFVGVVLAWLLMRFD